MALSKPATTDYPIHPLLRDRWSPRAFAPAPVPHEYVLSLLEAARWSPSGGNGQPWSFVIVSRTDAEGFERAVQTLNEGNVVWARNAPLLLLTVAQLNRDNGAPNRTALYDLGQAVAHLSIQAAALGLWVHQLGGFDQAKARELFAVPEGYEPVTWLVIGHQGNHEVLSASLREREQAVRTRKPLSDFVFNSSWGQPTVPLDSDH